MKDFVTFVTASPEAAQTHTFSDDKRNSSSSLHRHRAKHCCICANALGWSSVGVWFVELVLKGGTRRNGYN